MYDAFSFGKLSCLLMAQRRILLVLLLLKRGLQPLYFAVKQKQL